MELTLTTFVTIDGVMQSPGAPEEDPRNGFDLGGWLPPHFNAELGEYMNEVFDQADAILLGRRTYESMAAFWPSVTDPANRVASQLNSLPKHIVTTTPAALLSWSGSVALAGDVTQEVAELKQAPGRELQIHGSGALARSLMGQDLIDTYRLIVFPVVLGRGQQLFDGSVRPTGMRLTDTRSTASGVVIHTYRAAGRPGFGSVMPASG